MGNPYRSPHSGPPCPSFQKRFIFHFCIYTCDCVCLCKQTYATRKVKDQTGAFWVTKHWPLSSWHRKTASKAFPLVRVCLFVAQTVGRDLSDMREEAVCSGTYISLTTSSLHQCRWTKKPGMDKRHHLLKQQVTVSISTSPCVPFPFPSPSSLLLFIVPPMLQVVLVT